MDRFNSPSHLPQPAPAGAPLAFDVWDDDLMHDLCGKRLSKPVATILQSYEQLLLRKDMSDPEKANFLDSMRGEFDALREAVKAEFNEL